MQIITKDKMHIKGRRVYGPYLLLLPADQLAVIVLHTVITALLNGQRVTQFSRRAPKWLAGRHKMTQVAIEIGQVTDAPAPRRTRTRVYCDGVCSINSGIPI